MICAVRAENLTKRFGGAEAVRGISFSVAPGECFGLLGPNGAGKSSTMRMLGCLSPISAGTLQLFDLDAASKAREIKRRLGVVPQEDTLDQYLTAEENLWLYAGYFDLNGHEARRRAQEVLAMMALQDRARTPVISLSGGMKRRLSIARALISRPDLLILDEPTTGLDPQSRHLLWGQLRNIGRQGATLILSTHYMDEAEQLCDRLVVLEGGRIVAEGAPNKLIETHVSREVIEVVADAARQRQVQAALVDDADRFEPLHDRLLIFTARSDLLLPRLRDMLGADGRILARRASLEDVYLKLTGRSLREG